MPLRALGWGLREAQALQAVLQDLGLQLFLPPSQHASYVGMCSGDIIICSILGVNWESVRSPPPLLSGWPHLFVPLAQHWKYGGNSLPAASLLISRLVLPELQASDGWFLRSQGLGMAPAQTPCLCALLSVLARRGGLSPCWTVSLSSCCSGSRARQMYVAKLLYDGTWVKHALTAGTHMVFKQQSLYCQMQSCRLRSLG